MGQRKERGDRSVSEHIKWLQISTGLFVLFFAVLIGLSFPGLFFGNKTLFIGDYNSIVFPTAFFHRSCFLEGEFPYWNPYSGTGTPFMAAWYSLVLYPPALIYLLLPLNWSLGLFNIVHLFWGGLGAYQLAKRWTHHSFASAMAGIGYGLSGMMISTLMWSAIVAAHSWTPWVILANQLAWRGGGKRSVYAIVAGSLQMLASGPENILITWLISVVLLAIDCLKNRPNTLRFLLRFAGIVVAVSVICSIQLLPFFEFLRLSQRSVSFADTASAVPGWGWANLIFPGFYSAPVFHGLFVQKGYSILLTYYAGIGLVATAVLAVSGRHKALSWALLAILIASLLLCLGEESPVFLMVKQTIPVLGFMRYPVKFLYPASLCVPLLAALAISGFDHPGRTLKSSWLSMFTATFFFAALLVFLMWFCHSYPLDPLIANAWPTVYRQGIERTVILLLYGAGLGIWLFCRGRNARTRIGVEWFILLLTWYDLDSHMMRKIPLVENWAYEPAYLDWTNKPTLGKGRALVVHSTEVRLFEAPYQSPRQEILLKRKSLYGLLNLLEKTPKIRGNESLYLQRDDFVYNLFKEDRYPQRLANFLSVSHYTKTDKPFEWINRTSYWPWATAGQTAVFLGDQEAFNLIRSERFDPVSQVILPLEAKQWITATNGSKTDARIVASRFGLSSASITVEADKPTMLTVSQSYYPAWKARVNGKPSPLWRANYAYQALEIPAGRHQTDLFYRDSMFLSGSFVAFVGLLGLFSFYFRLRMC